MRHLGGPVAAIHFRLVKRLIRQEDRRRTRLQMFLCAFFAQGTSAAKMR